MIGRVNVMAEFPQGSVATVNFSEAGNEAEPR